MTKKKEEPAKVRITNLDIKYAKQQYLLPSFIISGKRHVSSITHDHLLLVNLRIFVIDFSLEVYFSHIHYQHLLLFICKYQYNTLLISNLIIYTQTSNEKKITQRCRNTPVLHTSILSRIQPELEVLFHEYLSVSQAILHVFFRTQVEFRRLLKFSNSVPSTVHILFRVKY